MKNTKETQPEENTQRGGQGSPTSQSSAPQEYTPKNPVEWAKITAPQYGINTNSSILLLREGEEAKVVIDITRPVEERANRFGKTYYLVPIAESQYQYLLAPKTVLRMILKRIEVKKSNELVVRHLKRGVWDVE